MKIESIIRRKNGTDVKLGNAVYRFRPDEEGRHVCDVENEDHIGTFLGIKEGYRIAKKGGAPIIPPAPAAPAIKTEDKPPATGDDASKLPENTKTLEPGGDGGNGGEGSGADGEVGNSAAGTDKESLESIKARFKEVFGRLPHHKWDEERILSELAKVGK